MMRKVAVHFSRATLSDAIFLIFLSSIIVFFLALSFENSESILANSTACLVIFFSTLIAVFFLWLFFLSGTAESSTALRFAKISLAPVFVLLLLIPYSYFYTQLKGVRPLGCLSIVFLGSLIMNAVLRKDTQQPPTDFSKYNGTFEEASTANASTGCRKTAGSIIYALVCKRPVSLPFIISILLTVYVIFFGGISVLRHLHYQNLSSFDVALYNQIQWNNIHGRFFESSISGSNFVTHNSPFLILLSPLYAVYPRPETLLVLKNLFLASSAVPFYLILKMIVHKSAIFPLLLGYLFYPFIVGQNFNAPHEICFLPPFLLFSFYFFLKNRFNNFLIFLLLSLSIKEHISLIAIMYGLYAFYLKRERPWVAAPILLGIFWGFLSVGIIYYFQEIYKVDPYPAWLIDNIKGRFMRPDAPFLANVLWGLKTSSLGHWDSFYFVYLLLSAAGLILPVFSPIALLGAPELMINLLASVQLIYPTWHYNIITACFLLIACAEAVKKLSSKAVLQRWGVPSHKIQELLSWLLCICVASHFFLWWDHTNIKKIPRYVETMNTAIRLIPKEASVSAPKHLVAYVSSRKDYFLLEDNRKGEYIVVDQDQDISGSFKDVRQSDQYVEIYHKDGVRVAARRVVP